ncbi:MAG: hypothetical protein JWM71_1177 [Solirubrobacteraceae bacterium]|nr:hypothetical protein [Solirubrobacteraceae bacterium]
MRPLPPIRHALISLAILVAAFAGATGIAELAGADSLGIALTFGQLGFAAALLYVLVRR